MVAISKGLRCLDVLAVQHRRKSIRRGFSCRTLIKNQIQVYGTPFDSSREGPSSQPRSRLVAFCTFVLNGRSSPSLASVNRCGLGGGGLPKKSVPRPLVSRGGSSSLQTFAPTGRASGGRSSLGVCAWVQSFLACKCEPLRSRWRWFAKEACPSTAFSRGAVLLASKLSLPLDEPLGPVGGGCRLGSVVGCRVFRLASVNRCGLGGGGFLNKSVPRPPFARGGSSSLQTFAPTGRASGGRSSLGVCGWVQSFPACGREPLRSRWRWFAKEVCPSTALSRGAVLLASKLSLPLDEPDEPVGGAEGGEECCAGWRSSWQSYAPTGTSPWGRSWTQSSPIDRRDAHQRFCRLWTWNWTTN